MACGSRERAIPYVSAVASGAPGPAHTYQSIPTSLRGFDELNESDESATASERPQMRPGGVDAVSSPVVALIFVPPSVSLLAFVAIPMTDGLSVTIFPGTPTAWSRPSVPVPPVVSLAPVATVPAAAAPLLVAALVGP